MVSKKKSREWEVGRSNARNHLLPEVLAHVDKRLAISKLGGAVLDGVLILLLDKLLDLNLLACNSELGGLANVTVDEDMLENLQ